MKAYTILWATGHGLFPENCKGYGWINPNLPGGANISTVLKLDRHLDYYPIEGHVFARQRGEFSDADICIYEGYVINGRYYTDYDGGYGVLCYIVSPTECISVCMKCERIHPFIAEYRYEGTINRDSDYRGIPGGQSRVRREVWLSVPVPEEYRGYFSSAERRKLSDSSTGWFDKDEIDSIVSYMLSNRGAATSSGYSSSAYWPDQPCDVMVPKRLSFDFRPGEEEWIDGASINGWPMSRRVLISCDEAYLEAATSLPQCYNNTIANVLDIAGSIAALCHGDIRGISGITDLWLKYRYAYCTTRADVVEYAAITQRLYAIASQTAVSSYGAVRFADNYQVKCTFSVNCADILPKDTQAFLSKYGMDLSLSKVWDMVPYSFVADWFFHVGDFLQRMEAIGNAIALPVTDCWCSIARDDGKYYLRFPYQYNGLNSLMTEHQISGKTFLFRVADSIALFL